MPMDDVGKAREWRGLYVRPRSKPGQVETNVLDLYATEVGAERLEDTIPSLRRLLLELY
jgi:hypothetical protein